MTILLDLPEILAASKEEAPKAVRLCGKRSWDPISGQQKTINNTWVCLKMLCTPKPNGFADHYPYEKWLFHWEYTQHFQTNPHGFGNVWHVCFFLLGFPIRLDSGSAGIHDDKFHRQRHQLYF